MASLGVCFLLNFSLAFAMVAPAVIEAAAPEGNNVGGSPHSENVAPQETAPPPQQPMNVATAIAPFLQSNEMALPCTASALEQENVLTYNDNGNVFASSASAWAASVRERSRSPRQVLAPVPTPQQDTNQWRKLLEALQQNLHQMFQPPPETDSQEARSNFLQSNSAAEMRFLRIVRDMLQRGASPEEVIAALPADAPVCQAAAFRSLVMSAQAAAAPENDVSASPTQFWTMEKLSPGEMLPSAPELPRLDENSARNISPTIMAMPTANPASAMQAVADQLQVPVEQLIIPTPPDGMCLYHCFSAWDLGDIWLQSRTEHGHCTDPIQSKIHAQLAKRLRERLVSFLSAIGRPDQANRLQQSGSRGYPGGDELPYIAELLHCTIVEHDLQHPAMPALTHCGGGEEASVVHIGHTQTPQGGPHWVLLRSEWPEA